MQNESAPNVSTEILENLFSEFIHFFRAKPKEQFETFETSSYVDDEENYKYSIFREAKRNLRIGEWQPSDIGTGKIQKAVDSAILRNVIHNFQEKENNLIYWRKKDRFFKMTADAELEQLFYDFYKNKISNPDAFSRLQEHFDYQTIAYLFFIKDSHQFLPISQQIFDFVISNKLMIVDFKTSRRASWENYKSFIEIVKQVNRFLKTKDPKTTLLDAHSFLWILGKQREEWLAEMEAEERLAFDDSLADEEEEKIRRSNLPETEKLALRKSRRGQGKFRNDVVRRERRCRLTGIADVALLVASHIKPWCDSSNEERLDGNNGLLLSPHADKLFDGGRISFSDAGNTLVRDENTKEVMRVWGLPTGGDVGDFSALQRSYLSYHRRKFGFES